jgi:HSP20 family protein
MNRHNFKRPLIAIALLALVGSVGAQTYYTHELATKVADKQGVTEQKAPIPDEQTQWDPWNTVHRDMMRMQSEMESLYNQAFHDFYTARFSNPPADASISLKEQGNDYVVKADIPGVQESDININLDGRLLSISAQTSTSQQETDAKGHAIEQDRYASSFQEAFTLPGPVNASGMHSQYQDGVLTLTIPKATS